MWEGRQTKRQKQHEKKNENINTSSGPNNNNGIKMALFISFDISMQQYVGLICNAM